MKHHLFHVWHHGKFYGLTLDRRKLPFHLFVQVCVVVIAFALTSVLH